VIANGVANFGAFPDWLDSPGFQFSPKTCSWIGVGIGFGGGVGLFSPEPVSKALGVATFVASGAAAVIGNCI
jgi:hypothetical protein